MRMRRNLRGIRHKRERGCVQQVGGELILPSKFFGVGKVGVGVGGGVGVRDKLKAEQCGWLGGGVQLQRGISHCSHRLRAGWLRNVQLSQFHWAPSKSSSL